MNRLLPILLLGLALPAISAEPTAPADNLVLKNVPPIPAWLPARIARYQNSRSARFLSWLPKDAGMLVATRFAETDQIHAVYTAEGRRAQLTFFGERIAWARHSPIANSSQLVFGKDVGGNEAYQIFRLDSKSGQAAMLTDGHSRNLSAIWNRTGDRIAFSSTKRNGKDFDIYLADPKGATPPALLSEVSGLHLPLEFSPDGKQLLVLHYVSINQSHLYLVDLDSKKRTDLTPADEKEVSYRQAQFSADGKRVYLTTDKAWEFVRLAYLEPSDLPKGLHFVTAKPNWDVEDFAISPDGKQIAFAMNEDGFSKLHLIDTRRHRAIKAPELPPGVLRSMEFSPSGRSLAVSLTGSRLPGDVFAIDTRKRKLTRWTVSETGGLDMAGLVEPELVHYPTFDQEVEGPRKIPALLYLPPAKGHKPPYPVLISIHGGPEGQARPTFMGSQNYRVNEMGIALLRPNVRGSAGYGKNYLLLDNGKLRENTVRDIGALLDWIETREDLDQSRVAVSGGSYGGYMSLASMVSFNKRLRCGIDYVGISSFITFLENTKPYRQDLRRAEYGDERKQGMRIFLDMISPLNSVDKILAPLLVLQGANDPRVPTSEAEQIVQKVEAQGGSVWYLLAKDEGHGFAKKRNRDFATLVRILFLEKYLMGAS
jgi:dipeptidyl aminopeptidase/acylaminoacyl peptidase